MWPFDKKSKEQKPLELQLPFVAPILPDSEKIALVLMGGGERGRFQLGPLKWLEQIGLLQQCKIFVGTSVGGLNALALLKNWGKTNCVDYVFEMWDKIRQNSDIYDGKLDVWGFVKMVTIKCKSILNQQGLYRVLKNHFDGMMLKDFGVDVGITATNLNTRKAEVFTNRTHPDMSVVLVGKMTSAIPGVFQYQEYNGDKYCDGGVLNNLPIETAIQMGATKVIMIGTGPRNLDRQEVKSDGVSVLLATLNVLLDSPEAEMWRDIDERYPSVEILKLYADQDTGDAVQFGRLDLRDIGYRTAVKHITLDKVKEWAK
ncbi:MAG TPA: patatin-like phospholipase family protein [Candidatus Goldiibacteriota bacterium]|nr:patatin-like phospholipase family protein [Candidatus Goldiibacteriota bacterium]